MSKLVQKIPKIIEATSSWSLDLLDLSCVDRTTTTSLLPTIYYNLLLFCCLRWWIRDNSLKNKHGFSFRTFFLCYPSSKRAGHCSLSLNLSTAATKCYVCRSAHIDDIGWKGFRSNLWLSITETLIGNSFASVLVTPVVILKLALCFRQIGNRIICSFCGLP